MILDLYSNTKLIPGEIKNEIERFDFEKIFNYFSDPFTFDIGIISGNSGDKIFGVGIIRVINEFKMILNPSLTNFKKAWIINMLMKEALNKSQCNNIIVEITQGGSHYENMLINHFNFQPTYGNVLRLEK